ncbi:MAG: DnaJ domain-containing protein [bacterium]
MSDLAPRIKDLYKILSVPRNADVDQIRRAFREQASKYHPDINKGEGAEEKFKELSFAYHTLADEVKRAKYDALLTPPIKVEGDYPQNHRPAPPRKKRTPQNPQPESEMPKNPFDLSDADKKDLDDLFGGEWMRMYEDEMKSASETYAKHSAEVDKMFKRGSKETDGMMKRVNLVAEEMEQKIGLGSALLLKVW